MSAVNWGDERLPTRFWEKVSPCPVSGCWWWTGANSCWGTPTFWLNNKNVSVKRLVFETFVSSAPTKDLIWAKCDQSCCNPAHLEIKATLPRATTHREVLREAKREKKRLWVKRSPHLLKGQMLRHRYGIGLEEFQMMLTAQSDACAICKDAFDADANKPYVDHSHKTGRIRALLCIRCNSGIGSLRDDLSILGAAIEYLRLHEEEQQQ